MFDFEKTMYLIDLDVPLRVYALISGEKVGLHPLNVRSGSVHATKDWNKDTVTISFEGKVGTQSQFQKPDPFVVLVTDAGLEVARFPATVKGSGTQYWKLSGTVQVKVDSNVKIESTKP
jgi:hypothetical protein